MLKDWTLVDALPPLQEDELQLWAAELEDADGLLESYTSLLTAEEQDRAARRRVGQVREQFVVTRACLRLLLGNALGVGPRQVLITEDKNGKPEAPIVQGRHVSFNVAHSKNMILIGLRRQGLVGVDVEHMNPATDVMEIALSYFTLSERQRLASFSDLDERRRAFYRCWTQKEAVAKADGRGLALSLTSFEVPIDQVSGVPVHLRESGGLPDKLFFVSDLPMSENVAGAIAVDSSSCRINKLAFPLRSLG